MDWRRVYDRQPSLVKDGAGFSVRLYNPNGLRFAEGSREITLLAEFLEQTEDLGRRFLLLPTFVKTLYVPSILSWDGGSLLTMDESERVLERLLLAATYKHYRLEINDDIYREAWRLVERAEEETKS